MTGLRLGERVLPLEGVTHVMGVINVSPESKNLHTVAPTVSDAVAMARGYRELGVSLIDVGGQSSHYDNPTIAVAEEISRVVPAISALVTEEHLVAIDTWKPEVARAAIEAGAVMVNDTGGLADPEMRRVVAESGVAAVAVHVEGANPHEVGEVEVRPDKAASTARGFAGLLGELATAGVDNVVLDPGIALNYRGDYQAYTRLQIEVIQGLSHIKALGRPVLVPIPRKAEDHRVAAYITLALEHDADLVRVHDVAMACDLVRLFGRAP